jgi:DNA-binding MarR family transcriptional regulator/GNAT superfamily N-acetyltransferase
MDDDAKVAQVRRFNRAVTQHVGALNEQYLGSNLSLGEARLLWEIGPKGTDVRSLRVTLGLDSGYLSRLLARLSVAGLVTLQEGGRDRRIRSVRLTRMGRAQRDVLDGRSDALAVSLLDSLSPEQRDQMVAAMEAIERLLVASTLTVAPVDPADPAARECVLAYFSELDRRFDTGFDPSRSMSAEDEELRPPRGVLVVARLRERPVGCGALKFHAGEAADLKRMWVAETDRGLGIGRRLLNELEGLAAAHGAEAVRLETNGTLTEAIGLYTSAGYVEVPAFNDEPYAHHWFHKRLGTPPKLSVLPKP